MSTITIRSQIRPATTEAAAATVARAYGRLSEALALLAQAFRAAQAGSRTARSATRELIARRRDAQRVYQLARRYDASQPGFASDLRCAASRALDAA